MLPGFTSFIPGYIYAGYIYTGYVYRPALQLDRAAPELDHASRDEDLAFGIDEQSEPAAAPNGFALSDGKRQRPQRAGCHKPAAEIRAGGARAWILEHCAVLREEESREHAVRCDSRPDICHRA